ncbi:MAG: hypothetical protein K2R98_12270 [Gemmataceae bacterium]|nr:hypothetical protein [Gemmataceae bacterium]
MASSFQRQSQIRKLIYAALIVALFTSTLFWRQFMEARANELALREENLGDVELTGSAVRLSLTGMRGVVVCGLWYKAIDKQRKQEWNQLELLIASITKLQPHYITPWMFQSWNLAYNVSVACDKPKDKYFYITRGIELLAEGERQNRNNPDMRFELGFYYQNKLGMADENNTLRTLFQMSCIDPVERDPKRMHKLDGAVDLDKFEAFCRKHPHLVRRLRDSLRCRTPEDVLDYLEENYELPSRYEYPPRNASGPAVASRLKPPEKQFPALPRSADWKDAEFTAESPQLPEGFDNFTAASVWFAYAQVPLPPPNRQGTPGNDDYDRNQYRMPRRMASIIFRGYPARAQSYIAERLQKEGWFDGGWDVDEGRQGANRWFPDRKVVLGENRNWSSESWTKARNLWEAHGVRTGLYLDPFAKAEKQRQAKVFRERFGIGENDLGPEIRPDEAVSPEIRTGFDAHRQLFWYERNRSMTNFGHFHAQARAESTPEAVAARRLFFKAQQMRKNAEPSAEILKVYLNVPDGKSGPHPIGSIGAFPEWKKVLDGNDDFRRDVDTQEETYKIQYEYLKLIQEEEATRLDYLKPLLVLEDFLAQGIRPAGATLWLPTANLIPPRTLASPVVGPFDGPAQDKQPYLSEEAIRRARQRMGFNDAPPKDPKPAPPPD